MSYPDIRRVCPDCGTIPIVQTIRNLTTKQTRYEIYCGNCMKIIYTFYFGRRAVSIRMWNYQGRI